MGTFSLGKDCPNHHKSTHKLCLTSSKDTTEGDCNELELSPKLSVHSKVNKEIDGAVDVRRQVPSLLKYFIQIIADVCELGQ